MLRTIAVVAAALPLLAPVAVGQPAVDPPSDPPVEQVAAEVVTVSGSGCQPGTVHAAMAVDNSRVALYPGMFGAEMGPAVPPTELRKSCQVVLDVQVPPGYSYAVSAVDYTAWVLLPEGATGQVRTNFYFAGGERPGLIPFSFTGPVDDIWWHQQPVDPLVWSSCDERRPLTIATELRIIPGGADPAVDVAAIYADYVDAPQWTYHLTWRRC